MEHFSASEHVCVYRQITGLLLQATVNSRGARSLHCFIRGAWLSCFCHRRLAKNIFS